MTQLSEIPCTYIMSHGHQGERRQDELMAVVLGQSKYEVDSIKAPVEGTYQTYQP